MEAATTKTNFANCNDRHPLESALCHSNNSSRHLLLLVAEICGRNETEPLAWRDPQSLLCDDGFTVTCSAICKDHSTPKKCDRAFKVACVLVQW